MIKFLAFSRPFSRPKWYFFIPSFFWLQIFLLPNLIMRENSISLMIVPFLFYPNPQIPNILGLENRSLKFPTIFRLPNTVGTLKNSVTFRERENICVDHMFVSLTNFKEIQDFYTTFQTISRFQWYQVNSMFFKGFKESCELGLYNHMEVYWLYRYFRYMIHIVSFILIKWYFNR